MSFRAMKFRFLRRVESPVTSGTFTALNGDPANCSNFKYGENKDFVRIRIDVRKLRQE